MRKSLAIVLALCVLCAAAPGGWHAAAEAPLETPVTSEEPQALVPAEEALVESAPEDAGVTEPTPPAEETTPAEEPADASEVTEAPATEPADAPESTEAPATEPAGTPEGTDEATAEPTGTPEGTEAPTTDPTGTPEGTDEATTEPTGTPEGTDEATAEPTGTPLPGESTPEASAAPTETPPADLGDPASPAYIQWDGYREYGSVQSLLEKGETIVLQTGDINAVQSDTTELGVDFGVDGEAFPVDEEKGETPYHVNVSIYDPNGATCEHTVFVWVSREAAPTPAEVLAEQITLVEDEAVADSYELEVALGMDGAFSLTSYPALTADAAFAFSLNDGDAQPCADTYAPAIDGSYRFYITSADGIVLARSRAFDVTLPEANVLDKDPAPAPTLTVTPDAHNTYGKWTAVAARFTLAQTPEGANTLGYTTDGGASWQIAASPFTAPEGAYTLRFCLLDASGAPIEITLSDEYALQIDQTAPLLTAVGQELTLVITAADSLSEIAGISADNGKTWNTPTLLGSETGIYQCAYRASAACTFDSGSLWAKDSAGNIAKSTAEVRLTAPLPSPESQTSGASSPSRTSSSTSVRIVSHAASDVDTLTAYNGVELTVQSGAMRQLVIGNTPLGLTLEAEGDAEPSFTAGFTRWNEPDGDADTLVLTAVDAADEDAVWTFDGSVCKKLAASGVDYLVFEVNGRVTALSTAGFTAGMCSRRTRQAKWSRQA